MAEAHLTERQSKWFATIRDGLERETGKSLDAWLAIARTCPETKHRARLKWFKDTHGLLQNRASYVLSEAFPSEMGWSEPEDLVAALWKDASAKATYEAVDALAMALEGAIRTPRKGYTAWARNFQFAAAKPLRDGSVALGLALEPDADPRLIAPKNESWSERLHAKLILSSPDAVDGSLHALLSLAHARS